MIIVKGAVIMNSNNENNNEELNVVSLGSVDNGQNLNVPINEIPPVNPIPEETVEVLEDVSTSEVDNSVVTPVEQLETPVDINAIPTDVPPLEPVPPINYDIPEVIDNAPLFNDIGTVPPISDVPIIHNEIAEPAEPPKSKKKGINKTLFVVIIILALCAVGGGVYVFLSKANSGAAVTLKAVKIEAGSTLSTNIKDYANFGSSVDISTCNFDTSEITDTNDVGAEYKFRITCGDKIYQGKATIVDTTAPDVTLREVNVGIDEDVTAEDFIAECKDASNCSYAFKDEVRLKEYLKSPSSYHVPIIVKDETGNEKEVTGTLNVNENSSTMALVCTKTFDDYIENSKFGLSEADSAFNKSTMRVYTFKFTNKEEYEKLRDENKDKTEITYLNITGKPSFDDDATTLTLSKKMAYSDLVSEFEGELPVSYGELKLFFDNKGYSCTPGFW